MNTPSNPLPSHITLAIVREELRAVGITITKRDGEFCVRVKGSKPGEGYFTNDLTDALDTGKLMAHGPEYV